MWKSMRRRMGSGLLILLVYGVFILLAFMVLSFFRRNLLSINAAYQSDNLPSSVHTAETDSSALNPLYFQLYLDVSPSMWGFSEEDGAMPSVAQALHTISSIRGSGQFSYFRFSDRVEATTETDFIRLMQGNNDYIENRYTVAQLSDEGLQPLIDAIDPNLIFSESYGGGAGFNVDNDRVNIIITDLNFLKNEEDKEGHDALLNHFTNNIVTYGTDGNISIYNISSPHTGMWTDAYVPNGMNLSSSQNSSFFIIILSRNSTTYDMFIEQWENAFASAGLYTGSKHVLKNDPTVGLTPFTLDRTMIRTDGVRDGLNWDNDIFRNFPENAVGLRIFNENSEDNETSNQLAMLQLPVAQITLSGCAEGMEDGLVSEGIKTFVKLYQKPLFRWEGYGNRDTSPIRSQNAALVSHGGQWYLSYEMYLDKSAEMSGILHKCLLVDVRFHLTDVYYSVPSWVQTVYDERLNSLALEEELESFFEQINTAKELYYQNISDTEKGYLGNLLIYINY